MKSFFKNLLSSYSEMEVPVPEPQRFPKLNNVPQWMEEKVAYYVQKYPDRIDNLFNPSSGDYLALNVIVATGENTFKEHIEHYREIKKRYPEAVKKAKENFLSYSYYPGGDPEDYN